MSNLEERQKQTLLTLESKLAQLPFLPMLLAHLAILDEDQDDFTEKIEIFSRIDPTFAAKLLRLGYSAGRRKDASVSLKRALTQAGAMALSNLVRTKNVVPAFVPISHGQRALWLHSLEVGLIAADIASHAPKLGIDSEFAYAAGLLHDFGRFVMFNESPEELGEIEEGGFASPDELIKAEEAVTGYNHAQLGGLAAKAWGLPDAIGQIIADHHKYGSAEEHGWTPVQLNLVHTIQMADEASFLTHEPSYLQATHEERCSIMNRRCVHLSWKEPPIATEYLSERIVALKDEAVRQAALIGIVLKDTRRLSEDVWSR